VAWTREGTGIVAQIDLESKGRPAPAPALAAEPAGLTVAAAPGVTHDSVAMSQAHVHAEDETVRVAPRDSAANGAGKSNDDGINHSDDSTALTVAGGGHTVALPEGPIFNDFNRPFSAPQWNLPRLIVSAAC
jgi:hypothetical protein